ncbi:MAG TPA: hypothetical protein VH268_00845, partial [Solirubrobacterales bacterium]|nr:hypothetical protein [Solirubrobacterales bacterium]
EAGIPAVEFGPAGAGHHGPDEWVSLTSLARYRRALGDFVRTLPIWLEENESGLGRATRRDVGAAEKRSASGGLRAAAEERSASGGLRAIEGGR